MLYYSLIKGLAVALIGKSYPNFPITSFFAGNGKLCKVCGITPLGSLCSQSIGMGNQTKSDNTKNVPHFPLRADR